VSLKISGASYFFLQAKKNGKWFIPPFAPVNFLLPVETDEVAADGIRESNVLNVVCAASCTLRNPEQLILKGK